MAVLLVRIKYVDWMSYFILTMDSSVISYDKVCKLDIIFYPKNSQQFLMVRIKYVNAILCLNH